MGFQELYFTFPRPLTQAEEDIFIGHFLAVRESEVLNKIANLKAASALQAKVPFNPAKPILEGYVLNCQMIEDGINDLFILEPVEGVAGKYRLKLSQGLNMKGVDKVGKLIQCFSNARWIKNLLADMKLKEVKVGGVE